MCHTGVCPDRKVELSVRHGQRACPDHCSRRLPFVTAILPATLVESPGSTFKPSARKAAKVTRSAKESTMCHARALWCNTHTFPPEIRLRPRVKLSGRSLRLRMGHRGRSLGRSRTKSAAATIRVVPRYSQSCDAATCVRMQLRSQHDSDHLSVVFALYNTMLHQSRE